MLLSELKCAIVKKISVNYEEKKSCIRKENRKIKKFFSINLSHSNNIKITYSDDYKLVKQ